MKLLVLIRIWIAQSFYRWAEREINPSHPDLPRIILRQRELADLALRASIAPRAR